VDLGVPWNGGVLATAGNLVFQGGADGHFSAYAADSGNKLWSFYAGLGISAAPISYAVNGTQYIAILVGWGGGGSYIGTSAMAQHGWEYGKYPRRLLVFAREGKAVLPALFEPRPDVKPLDDPRLVIDTDKAARGEQQYATHCFGCHGSAVISSGGAPELRASPIAMNREAFGALLQGGARQQQGMPRFQEFDEARIDELWSYIRRRARETLQD
jgi:quinohemoprotein ethanol dehydrogenase